MYDGITLSPLPYLLVQHLDASISPAIQLRSCMEGSDLQFQVVQYQTH